MPINAKLSRGILGSVLADPGFIPGSTLHSPLPAIEECPDIFDNRALSVRYYFPKMLRPHRSLVLPGAKHATPVLDMSDRDYVRSGGGGGGRGGRGRGGGRGGGPGMGGGGGNRSGYNTPSGHSTPTHSYRGGGRDAYTPTYSGGSNGYDSRNSVASSPWMNPAGNDRAPRGGYAAGLGGYGASASAAPSSRYGGYGVGAAYGGYAASPTPGSYGNGATYGGSYSMPTNYAAMPPASGPAAHSARPHQQSPYASPYAAPAAGYQGYGSGARGGYAAGQRGGSAGRGGGGGY